MIISFVNVGLQSSSSLLLLSTTTKPSSLSLSSFVNKNNKKKNNSNNNNNELNLLIAKTVGLQDVQETINDIEYFQQQQQQQHSSSTTTTITTSIQWKLFCYSNDTYTELLKFYNNINNNNNIQIHYEYGWNKVNFWYKYLNPTKTTNNNNNNNYIWLMDGDISIRNIQWDCFWDIIINYYRPAIFAPALYSSYNIQSEKRKIYVGSTHPHWCYNNIDNNNTNNTNDFQHLIGMDVLVVESQLPIFTKIAWDIVYNVFTKYVNGWGSFQSMWSPDRFWCKIIDYYLYNITTDIDRLGGGKKKKKPQMDWKVAKETCTIQDNITIIHNEQQQYQYQQQQNQQNQQQLPHACMIIHATPVKHYDTKTISVHEKDGGISGKEFMKIARNDMEKYKRGLSSTNNFFVDSYSMRRSLFQTYLSYDKKYHYQCQHCKHIGCVE